MENQSVLQHTTKEREMKAEQMQSALESSIAKHSSAEALGTWNVSVEDDQVMLVWSCPEEEAPLEMNGDEPWCKWGGDSIIESAGIGGQDDSGVDSYHDKFGVRMTEQWVKWYVAEEDDE